MNNPAQKSYQLYIDGKWVDASDGGTLDVYCPANGEQLSTIADATKEDVDRAGDVFLRGVGDGGKLLAVGRAVHVERAAVGRVDQLAVDVELV